MMMYDPFTKIGSGQLQGKHSKKERQHRLYKQVHRRFVIVYSFHGAKNAYVMRHFILKITILPRQARDKHKGKHSKTEWSPRFTQAIATLFADHEESTRTFAGAENAFLAALLYEKTIDLPRQARDKHIGKTSLLREKAFSAGLKWIRLARLFKMLRCEKRLVNAVHIYT
eukprot:COSAG06_NODE_2777_length_6300_cov_38.831963_2_plen_170_part_00